MELQRGNEALEALNTLLNDEGELKKYRAVHDHYKPALLPRLLGHLLVWCGDVVYGAAPSYAKFRAVEVIARVPYHSWSSAIYTLLTLFYTNEQKAICLSEASKFAYITQDNETMHVVVISQLAKKEGHIGFVRYTLIPMIFAFFYFWAAYWLYIVKPRYAYELNYVFESHAFEQYSQFIKKHADKLKKKPIQSAFLAWYGRTPANQYEFFRSVRNDEIIHRNSSIEEIRE